jgi:hypothetical protein
MVRIRVRSSVGLGLALVRFSTRSGHKAWLGIVLGLGQSRTLLRLG